MEQPETNLVFFDTSGTGMTANQLAERVRAKGIMLSSVGRYRARACTHLDVDRAGIETALQAFRQVATN